MAKLTQWLLTLLGAAIGIMAVRWAYRLVQGDPQQKRMVIVGALVVLVCVWSLVGAWTRRRHRRNKEDLE